MQPQTKAGDLRARTVDGRSVKREAGQLIKPNRRLTSFDRLEIYHQQYWLRLLSSIREDFSGLEAILGARKFEQLTRRYLSECPSRSFTLRNLGDRLVSWLLGNRHLISPFGALAIDMARLEWAHIEAFDRGAASPVASDAITSGDSSFTLSLQPYIRLLTLDHAVDDLLLEVRELEGAPLTRKRIREYASRSREMYVAVHRVHGSVYYKDLTREAYRALLAIRSHKPLEQAITDAFESSPLSDEQNWC